MGGEELRLFLKKSSDGSTLQKNARGYMERKIRIAATMKRLVATARQAADIIHET